MLDLERLSDLSLLDQRMVRDRFRREAEIVSRIGPPFTAALLQDGADADPPFIALELLSGEPLSVVRDRHPRGMPVAMTLDIICRVLRAIHGIHLGAIVHRDIKPDNIFCVDSSRIAILDFGFARDAKHSDLTLPSHRFGTPNYMAPEQARGAWSHVDQRADIWAVGAVMYTLLTGEPVRPATSVEEKLEQAATLGAPRLATTRPGLPFSVCDLVDRALSTNPVDRWNSADEMLRRAELVLLEVRSNMTATARTTVYALQQQPWILEEDAQCAVCAKRLRVGEHICNPEFCIQSCPKCKRHLVSLAEGLPPPGPPSTVNLIHCPMCGEQLRSGNKPVHRVGGHVLYHPEARHCISDGTRLRSDIFPQQGCWTINRSTFVIAGRRVEFKYLDLAASSLPWPMEAHLDGSRIDLSLKDNVYAAVVPMVSNFATMVVQAKVPGSWTANDVRGHLDVIVVPPPQVTLHVGADNHPATKGGRPILIDIGKVQKLQLEIELADSAEPYSASAKLFQKNLQISCGPSLTPERVTDGVFVITIDIDKSAPVELSTTIAIPLLDVEYKLLLRRIKEERRTAKPGIAPPPLPVSPSTATPPPQIPTAPGVAAPVHGDQSHQSRLYFLDSTGAPQEIRADGIARVYVAAVNGRWPDPVTLRIRVRPSERPTCEGLTGIRDVAPVEPSLKADEAGDRVVEFKGDDGVLAYGFSVKGKGATFKLVVTRFEPHPRITLGSDTWSDTPRTPSVIYVDPDAPVSLHVFAGGGEFSPMLQAVAAEGSLVLAGGHSSVDLTLAAGPRSVAALIHYAMCANPVPLPITLRARPRADDVLARVKVTAVAHIGAIGTDKAKGIRARPNLVIKSTHTQRLLIENGTEHDIRASSEWVKVFATGRSVDSPDSGSDTWVAVGRLLMTDPGIFGALKVGSHVDSNGTVTLLANTATDVFFQLIPRVTTPHAQQWRAQVPVTHPVQSHIFIELTIEQVRAEQRGDLYYDFGTSTTAIFSRFDDQENFLQEPEYDNSFVRSRLVAVWSHAHWNRPARPTDFGTPLPDKFERDPEAAQYLCGFAVCTNIKTQFRTGQVELPPIRSIGSPPHPPLAHYYDPGSPEDLFRRAQNALAKYTVLNLRVYPRRVVTALPIILRGARRRRALAAIQTAFTAAVRQIKTAPREVIARGLGVPRDADEVIELDPNDFLDDDDGEAGEGSPVDRTDGPAVPEQSEVVDSVAVSAAIDEGTAAAFHELLKISKHRKSKGGPSHVLVLDVGGGTTDITLFRVNEKDSQTSRIECIGFDGVGRGGHWATECVVGILAEQLNAAAGEVKAGAVLVRRGMAEPVARLFEAAVGNEEILWALAERVKHMIQAGGTWTPDADAVSKLSELRYLVDGAITPLAVEMAGSVTPGDLENSPGYAAFLSTVIERAYHAGNREYSSEYVPPKIDRLILTGQASCCELLRKRLWDRFEVEPKGATLPRDRKLAVVKGMHDYDRELEAEPVLASLGGLERVVLAPVAKADGTEAILPRFHPLNVPGAFFNEHDVLDYVTRRSSVRVRPTLRVRPATEEGRGGAVHDMTTTNDPPVLGQDLSVGRPPNDWSGDAVREALLRFRYSVWVDDEENLWGGLFERWDASQSADFVQVARGMQRRWTDSHDHVRRHPLVGVLRTLLALPNVRHAPRDLDYDRAKHGAKPLEIDEWRTYCVPFEDLYKPPWKSQTDILDGLDALDWCLVLGREASDGREWIPLAVMKNYWDPIRFGDLVYNVLNQTLGKTFCELPTLLGVRLPRREENVRQWVLSFGPPHGEPPGEKYAPCYVEEILRSAEYGQDESELEEVDAGWKEEALGSNDAAPGSAGSSRMKDRGRKERRRETALVVNWHQCKAEVASQWWRPLSGKVDFFELYQERVRRGWENVGWENS